MILNYCKNDATFETTCWLISALGYNPHGRMCGRMCVCLCVCTYMAVDVSARAFTGVQKSGQHSIHCLTEHVLISWALKGWDVNHPDTLRQVIIC